MHVRFGIFNFYFVFPKVVCLSWFNFMSSKAIYKFYSEYLENKAIY